MKHVRLLVAVALLLAVPMCLFAAAPKVASDQALLVLRSNDYADTQTTADELEAAGCHAQHIMSSRAVIASVPREAEATVRALPNVVSLFRGKVSNSALAVDGDVARGIGAWHAVLEGDGPLPARPTTQPKVIRRPVADAGARLLSTEAYGAAGVMSPMVAAASRAPGYYDTSDFMIGKVAVGVILPESTGNGENWNNGGAGRQDTVFNQVVKGLNQLATKGGSAAHLTFVYDKRFSVPTQYEPIQMTPAQEPTWTADVLGNMGYTNGDSTQRCRDYVNWMRGNYKTDWAFAIFVADSYNNPDGEYETGGYAWADLFGPYEIQCYDLDSLGYTFMYASVAHETGHIFCAGDEYNASWFSCSSDYWYGYLWVGNDNCETDNPNSVPCIMRWTETDANGNIQMCPTTKVMLGWRDSDGDGIYDPVDCAHNNTLNSVTSPQPLGNVSFTGTVNITPTTCAHPQMGYGGPNTCTINKITKVEYKVDGGTAFQATASDGAFSSDSEDYKFTVSLGVGTHTIQTWSYDNYGNVGASNTQNVTVTGGYDIVVDNNSSGFTASTNWTTGTMSTDKYGVDYRYRSTASVSDIAKWTVNVPVAGNYDVFVWYPQGTNRSTIAPYFVDYNGGSAKTFVNQQINGGKWNLLGRYNFLAGNNTVRLSCWTDLGYYVMADAVRFVGPY